MIAAAWIALFAPAAAVAAIAAAVRGLDAADKLTYVPQGAGPEGLGSIGSTWEIDASAWPPRSVRQRWRSRCAR